MDGNKVDNFVKLDGKFLLLLTLFLSLRREEKGIVINQEITNDDIFM